MKILSVSSDPFDYRHFKADDKRDRQRKEEKEERDDRDEPSSNAT